MIVSAQEVQYSHKHAHRQMGVLSTMNELYAAFIHKRSQDAPTVIALHKMDGSAKRSTA